MLSGNYNVDIVTNSTQLNMQVDMFYTKADRAPFVVINLLC